jgi:excisionase family DNA binding protein
MTTTRLRKSKNPAPSARDRKLADTASRQLARCLRPGHTLTVALRHPGAATVELPAPAADLLLKVLGNIAAGQSVSLVTTQPHLTTQQAAELLGVSRPFIIKQIAAGLLPAHKVGSHRRIAPEDLRNYQRHLLASRHQALDALAAEGQALGLDYQ